jgi:glycosyltransferase involved in cell wall biosynthesis
MRIALLTEVAAPYRAPMFRALAERVELRVFFLGSVDPRRAYEAPERGLGFDWEVLPGVELRRGPRWAVLSRGVVRALRSFRPDVVIVGGWNQPAFWQALGWSLVRRVPVVCWVESTLRDARSRSAPGERAKRAFLHACAAVLVPGRAAEEYVLALGVEPGRIETGPNAVPRDASVTKSDTVSGVRLLCVGRLAPEKGIDVLLRAVEGLPVEVEIAGNGTPPREHPENVRFLGWVEPSELRELYARADVFVLPSLSEPWGMVLNEAAAAGLPLVATDAVGAAHDLIEDGVNGFVVPAGDAVALREAIAKLVDDPELRARAARRSHELAAGFTPERWADAVVRLAERLVA